MTNVLSILKLVWNYINTLLRWTKTRKVNRTLQANELPLSSFLFSLLYLSFFRAHRRQHGGDRFGGGVFEQMRDVRWRGLRIVPVSSGAPGGSEHSDSGSDLSRGSSETSWRLRSVPREVSFSDPGHRFGPVRRFAPFYTVNRFSFVNQAAFICWSLIWLIFLVDGSDRLIWTKLVWALLVWFSCFLEIFDECRDSLFDISVFLFKLFSFINYFHHFVAGTFYESFLLIISWKFLTNHMILLWQKPCQILESFS